MRFTSSGTSANISLRYSLWGISYFYRTLHTMRRYQIARSNTDGFAKSSRWWSRGSAKVWRRCGRVTAWRSVRRSWTWQWGRRRHASWYFSGCKFCCASYGLTSGGIHCTERNWSFFKNQNIWISNYHKFQIYEFKYFFWNFWKEGVWCVVQGGLWCLVCGVQNTDVCIGCVIIVLLDELFWLNYGHQRKIMCYIYISLNYCWLWLNCMR